MGYQPPSTVYVLDFEDTPYRGMEVRMRATKLGAVLAAPELIGVKHRLEINQRAETMPDAGDLEAVLGEITDIANHLVSWNLDDADGTPLPADLEGLKTLELPVVKAIGSAWQAAMTEVAPPLPRGSSSGPLPDLPSVPMAPIPASLLSSSVPS